MADASLNSDDESSANPPQTYNYTPLQDYAQYQPNNGSEARRVQPNDYSNMAYFNGLLCLIVGCYTIYLSWKVRNCYEKEDYNGALVASRRCFWIHFVVFSVAGWLLFLVIALYIFYGFAVAKI
ncbi:uncharacterized protein LOC134193300 isoform X2 [Corticium candelabrum]|uniref:uncharacterized protein LOC134193300 isoform X2 n=1 Tax=Corticium candelabrum TaxID=121492 RepID=UPI002E264A4F|nr:uncharacterized protein LOC134193300 isoform X2 [Corticium candelabrum]